MVKGVGAPTNRCCSVSTTSNSTCLSPKAKRCAARITALAVAILTTLFLGLLGLGIGAALIAGTELAIRIAFRTPPIKQTQQERIPSEVPSQEKAAPVPETHEPQRKSQTQKSVSTTGVGSQEETEPSSAKWVDGLLQCAHERARAMEVPELFAQRPINDAIFPLTSDRELEHFVIDIYEQVYQELFLERGKTGFFIRHGWMHACHVAANVSYVVALYREFGDPDAQQLSPKEENLLTLAAFFLHYGRCKLDGDLAEKETAEMRAVSAAKCILFLRKRTPNDQCVNAMVSALLGKDLPLGKKSFAQKVLQNCASISLLRREDRDFDYRKLDLYQEIQSGKFKGEKKALEQRLLEWVDVNTAALAINGDLGAREKILYTSCGKLALEGFLKKDNVVSVVSKRKYERDHQYFLRMRGRDLKENWDDLLEARVKGEAQAKTS